MCLGRLCSNFNVFLSVFCRKVVQNRNVDDCAEEVTHEAIDYVGGDRRLEVQEYWSNSGNYDQVWGYGRIDGLSTDWWTFQANYRSDKRLVPVTGWRNIYVWNDKGIDGPCFWYVDWMREDSRMTVEEDVKYGPCFWYVCLFLTPFNLDIWYYK